MAEMTEHWQESKLTIAERGTHLLITGDFSDVEFIVGSDDDKNHIPAHSLILSMGSPVFAAMFSSPWERSKPIRVADITPNIFCKLLKYLYTDNICLGENIDEVLQFYYAADKYMIPKVKNECNIYLQSVQLNSENICTTLETAKYLNIEFLEKRCMTFITTLTSDVLKSPGFQNAKMETVRMILNMEEASFSSELEFFSALLDWGRSECRRRNLEENSTNMEAIVKPLFPYIRFLNMSVEEFIKAVNSAEDLFDKAEAFTVIKKIVNQKSNQLERLPSWCGSNSSRRSQMEIVFNININNFIINCDIRTSRFGHFSQSDSVSTIYLKSFNNNLVIKGVTLCWEDPNKQNCRSLRECPISVEVLNLATNAHTKETNRLRAEKNKKLIFSHFIPVALDERVTIKVCVKDDPFSATTYISTREHETENFSVQLNCVYHNYQYFIVKEIIYCFKA